MTRKTVSERRIAGANKQIAELTQALHEAREYGTLLADDVRDKSGLIKHLKGTNNRLRIKLGEAEAAAKASNDTITQQSQQLHEIATAASATAENRDQFKKLAEDRARQVENFQNLSQFEFNRASANKESRIKAEKDAKSWKYSFFVVVAITVIAQVVNYVAG